MDIGDIIPNASEILGKASGFNIPEGVEMVKSDKMVGEEIHISRMSYTNFKYGSGPTALLIFNMVKGKDKLSEMGCLTHGKGLINNVKTCAIGLGDITKDEADQDRSFDIIFSEEDPLIAFIEDKETLDKQGKKVRYPVFAK